MLDYKINDFLAPNNVISARLHVAAVRERGADECGAVRPAGCAGLVNIGLDAFGDMLLALDRG
jgi:hypothetical protein